MADDTGIEIKVGQLEHDIETLKRIVITGDSTPSLMQQVIEIRAELSANGRQLADLRRFLYVVGSGVLIQLLSQWFSLKIL